jgi:hypothetical protein
MYVLMSLISSFTGVITEILPIANRTPVVGNAIICWVNPDPPINGTHFHPCRVPFTTEPWSFDVTAYIVQEHQPYEALPKVYEQNPGTPCLNFHISPAAFQCSKPFVFKIVIHIFGK